MSALFNGQTSSPYRTGIDHAPENTDPPDFCRVMVPDSFYGAQICACKLRVTSKQEVSTCIPRGPPSSSRHSRKPQLAGLSQP